MYKQQTTALIAEAYLYKGRDVYRLKTPFNCRFGHFTLKRKRVVRAAPRRSLASHSSEHQHGSHGIEIVGGVRQTIQSMSGTRTDGRTHGYFYNVSEFGAQDEARSTTVVSKSVSRSLRTTGASIPPRHRHSPITAVLPAVLPGSNKNMSTCGVFR